MLDLDGFKMLNDTFGHEAGDGELTEVAQTLLSVVRKYDVVGRLGGDEFVVFLQDIPGRDIAAKKAGQICRLIKKQFGDDVFVSSSVGIAMHPDNGATFGELYHAADSALYYVKEHGKNNFAFFDNKMLDTDVHFASEIESSTANITAKNKRMLIVDDDEINRKILIKMFSDNFVINTETSGAAALSYLHRYSSVTSVVLLDLVMPGTDGFDVLKKMRATPALQTIPVVVVSGLNDRESTLKAIRYGASDFVTKPIDADLLRMRVDSALLKAENASLRAQNVFLAMQDIELSKYRAILESEKRAVAEYDTESGAFVYDETLKLRIPAAFDNRPIWEIFESDDITDSESCKLLRNFIEDFSVKGSSEITELTIPLKCLETTVDTVIKLQKHSDEFNGTNELLIIFSF